MEKIHGALRVRGGGEDRALVLAEDLEPMRQVRGVVLTRLWRDAEIRAQERGAQLSDELFTGVARVAEALAAEVAIETARMLRPVRQLMRFGGGVALSVAERLRHGELDHVRTRSVVGHAAAVTDDGARCC